MKDLVLHGVKTLFPWQYRLQTRKFAIQPILAELSEHRTAERPGSNYTQKEKRMPAGSLPVWKLQQGMPL